MLGCLFVCLFIVCLFVCSLFVCLRVCVCLFVCACCVYSCFPAVQQFGFSGCSSLPADSSTVKRLWRAFSIFVYSIRLIFIPWASFLLNNDFRSKYGYCSSQYLEANSYLWVLVLLNIWLLVCACRPLKCVNFCCVSCVVVSERIYPASCCI